MAKQSAWNKNYWKKLDGLSKTKKNAIFKIMKENVDYAVADLREMVPYLYGGLSELGVYGDVKLTEHGVTATFGIDNDVHVNLRGSRYYTKSKIKIYIDENGQEVEEREDALVQHKGPLVRQDKVTNRQLANILYVRPSKTGSQGKMEEVYNYLQEEVDVIRGDIKEYLRTKRY